jgi:hypothetical protein
MRRTLRTMASAGILALGGAWGLGTSSAWAHDGVNPGGTLGGVYPGGGGHGAPGFSYYGNGGHDAAPHWHTTQTPLGSFSWFGTGAHDFRPHVHTQTPYGITSYSGGRFHRTRSYSPPTPYIYRPW